MTFMRLRCLLFVVCVQLCAAVPSTDLALSACAYASETLYVVNVTATETMLPSDYVECTKATGAATALCEICSCREKKAASVDGVTVAWVVCVGSGDATTCANNAASGQEYCGSPSTACGSGPCDGSNIGESSSNTISEVGIINGSDASAGPATSNSTTIAPSISVDTNVDGGSSDASAEVSSILPIIDPSASVETSVGVDSSDAASAEASSSSSKIEFPPASADGSSSIIDTTSSLAGSNLDSKSSSTSSYTELETSSSESGSEAMNEDNVIPADAGTVEPAQATLDTSIKQNIILPSDNGSTSKLDTNNGASTKSNWSGTRLTAMVTILGAIAAVAAIVVFVAVRRDQDKKNNEPGTPTDDDDSCLVTPTTDGKYYKGRRGDKGLIDSSDNSMLSSIVVIGANDDLLTPIGYGVGQQYRSLSWKMSSGYARSESVKASDGEVRLENSNLYAAPPSQLQFNISHGPSTSDLPSPTHDPIYDSSNTQESFSSSLTSDAAQPQSERMYESEDISSGSFRELSATYSGDSIRDSASSSEPEPSPDQEANLLSSKLTTSFTSSLSSVEYAPRDTEASEHMNPSEFGTTSSRIAMSFESNFEVDSETLSGVINIQTTSLLSIKVSLEYELHALGVG
ncbi:hypothetical protein PInf_008838 [Phytophthora infestans]|nr:hypothetical protein PInf_008838 [Phytophthora infestans]